MKTTEDILELHSLGYYLDTALRSMVGEVNSALKQSGLNLQHSQFSILLYLEKKEGISQTELALLIGKNPAAILRSINYLESKGYVYRKAKSGCENMLLLTENGKAILPNLNIIANEVTQKAMSGLSEENKKTLCILLNNIAKNFQSK